MAQQTINLGTAPSGTDGDDARTAFQKVNSNFSELYGGSINQPTNAKLTAISASVWAANQLMYSTGINTVAVTALTLAGRALLDDADAPAQRVTLGLGGAILQALQALTMSANGVPYFASASTMAVQASTVFGRGLWNLADGLALRNSAGMSTVGQAIATAATAAVARTALELGTGALLTATTSTTDNAAGRALRVGDHGVGISLSTMAAAASLDAVVAHSFFSSQDPSPPDWTTAAQELNAKAALYPMGINMYRSAAVRGQFAISYASSQIGDVRFRTTYGSGTWSDWKTLLGRGDFGIGINTNLESTATTWDGNKFTGWASAAPDSPFGTNSVGLDMGYASDRRMQIAISTGNALFYRYANTPGGQQNWSQVLSSYNSATLPISSALAPSTDNAVACGATARRWSVVVAATGTISTSDARFKTPIRKLSANEINAARDLGKEIGAYRWLESVHEKGDQAREHIGMTVQRAIEIMESHGLDPFNYGFVCYDQWDALYEDIPAVEEIVPADPVYGYVEVPADPVWDMDENGVPFIANEGEMKSDYVQTNVDETKVVEIEPAKRNLITAAGDRYSFRYDELNMFIAAGFEARLAALEATII